MNKIILIAKDDIQNDLRKYLLLLFVFCAQGILSAAAIYVLPELLKAEGIPVEFFPSPTPTSKTASWVKPETRLEM